MDCVLSLINVGWRYYFIFLSTPISTVLSSPSPVNRNHHRQHLCFIQNPYPESHRKAQTRMTGRWCVLLAAYQPSPLLPNRMHSSPVPSTSCSMAVLFGFLPLPIRIPTDSGAEIDRAARCCTAKVTLFHPYPLRAHSIWSFRIKMQISTRWWFSRHPCAEKEFLLLWSHGHAHKPGQNNCYPTDDDDDVSRSAVQCSARLNWLLVGVAPVEHSRACQFFDRKGYD